MVLVYIYYLNLNKLSVVLSQSQDHRTPDWAKYQKHRRYWDSNSGKYLIL